MPTVSLILDSYTYLADLQCDSHSADNFDIKHIMDIHLYGCYSLTLMTPCTSPFKLPIFPALPFNPSSWWRDVFVALVLNDSVVGETFIGRGLQNVAKIQGELIVLKI